MSDPLDDKQLIVVTGYPRSGNIWIARMIGACLNAPVMGPPPFYFDTLVAEGQDRQSPYAVVQGHLYQTSQDSFLNRSTIDLSKQDSAKLVLVIRDPRDVAVSVQYYWKMSTLKKAVQAMLYSFQPTDPDPVCGRAWHLFYNEWLQGQLCDATIRYSEMRMNPQWELRHLMIELGLPFDAAHLDRIVKQHHIEERKRWMHQHGDEYYFGKEAQLEHIRSGLVSYWRDHWTQTECELVHETWWPLLEYLNYETNMSWWKLEKEN